MTKHDGDYELRVRGLEGLFRVRDLVEWDVLRTEMVMGVADGSTPHTTPYIILGAYADIGEPCTGWTAGHPMGYLASAIRIQGVSGKKCPLLVTALEELIELRSMLGS